MATRLSKLSSPAFQVLKDLEHDPDALRRFEQRWTERLSKTIEGPPRKLFYNPLTTDTADDTETADVAWTAFPKRLIPPGEPRPDMNAYRQGDQGPDDPQHEPRGPRGWQDEYCEWSVARDPVDDKITRVTFTCENPDYWDELWNVSPETVARLYSKLTGETVSQAELTGVGGRYNPNNRWNNSTTRGAIHLVSPPNNLFAEIRLAADATVLRKREDGTPITDRDELIACAGFGSAGRHSDPTIGAAVNSLARDEQAGQITLQDPFGLYIEKASLDEADGFQLPPQAPSNAHPRDYWTIERGTDDFILRVSYSVPTAHGFKVGDIQIDNQRIQFGGQITQKMRIKLSALYGQIGQGQPTELFCDVPELLAFLDDNLSQIMLGPQAGASGRIFLLCTPATRTDSTFELDGKGTLTIRQEVSITNPNFRVFEAFLQLAPDASPGRVFFQMTNPDGRQGLVTDPGLTIQAVINPLGARVPTAREMSEEFRHLGPMPQRANS